MASNDGQVNASRLVGRNLGEKKAAYGKDRFNRLPQTG